MLAFLVKWLPLVLSMVLALYYLGEFWDALLRDDQGMAVAGFIWALAFIGLGAWVAPEHE
jgi:hypothetical protein